MISVKAALLCDAATVREGLLHVLGAGITLFGRESYPAPFGASLAMMFELSTAPDGLAESHEIRVVAYRVGDERVQLFEAAAPVLHAQPASPSGAGYQLIPIVLDLNNAGLPEEGQYEIVILTDDVPSMSLRFTANIVSFAEPVVSDPLL